jgi:hypothetical protein
MNLEKHLASWLWGQCRRQISNFGTQLETTRSPTHGISTLQNTAQTRHHEREMDQYVPIRKTDQPTTLKPSETEEEQE